MKRRRTVKSFLAAPMGLRALRAAALQQGTTLPVDLRTLDDGRLAEELARIQRAWNDGWRDPQAREAYLRMEDIYHIQGKQLFAFALDILGIGHLCGLTNVLKMALDDSRWSSFEAFLDDKEAYESGGLLLVMRKIAALQKEGGLHVMFPTSPPPVDAS